MDNPSSMNSVNLRAMEKRKMKEKFEIVHEVIDSVISRERTDKSHITLVAAKGKEDLVSTKRARGRMKLPH